MVDTPDLQTSEQSSVVLYVEDNKANVFLMQQVVKRVQGVELLIAETAEAGVEIAVERRPNLVVMDINLPGMDGFEALELMKGTAETNNIPVIALSADAMPHQVEKGLKTGFVAYLTKPLDIPEFLTMLQDLLQK